MRQKIVTRLSIEWLIILLLFLGGGLVLIYASYQISRYNSNYEQSMCKIVNNSIEEICDSECNYQGIVNITFVPTKKLFNGTFTVFSLNNFTEAEVKLNKDYAIGLEIRCYYSPKANLPLSIKAPVERGDDYMVTFAFVFFFFIIILFLGISFYVCCNNE